MEERKRFAVIGGDARQAAAGRALARAGYEVCGAEEVARADYILLPLPLDEARTPLIISGKGCKRISYSFGICRAGTFNLLNAQFKI